MAPLKLLALVFSIGFAGQAQEIQPLESGKPIERELAGGQTHPYQITLQAAEFMRVVVEQKGINVALVVTGPDDKQLKEANLTSPFGKESLSYEVTAGGKYRLAVRSVNPGATAGAYEIRLELRKAATAEDRQRIAAERLLAEANPLVRQGGASSQQAIEKYQEATRLWRELGDRYWEAYTVYSVGRAYNRLSRNDTAIEYLQQALQISRETQDSFGEANALNTLGSSHYSLGRNEKAIEYFEQTLIVRRKIKDREGEGGALLNLGAAYNSMRRNDKSIEYYEQALPIMREMKNRGAEGFILTGLGNVNLSLGRYEKAIEYQEQSLSIYRDVKDRVTEGTTLSALGNVYKELGRYDRSLDYYEQALSIAREVKDRRGEGTALNNVGRVHFNLSRYDKAIEYFEQALKVSRDLKDRLGERTALNNQGNAYSSMGSYDKAVELYEQALAINRELKDRDGEATTLINLGIVYNFLGRQDRAIGSLEKALPITRELKSPDSEKSAFNNLGNVHLSQGRYDKAIEYYERALAMNREMKTRAGEGALLSNLGYVNLQLGRYDKSIEYAERTLAVSRETKDRVVEGRAHAILGHSYGSLGRYENASQSLTMALAIFREVNDHTSEARTLYGFARVERDRGNLNQARNLVEQSLKIAESLRSDIYNQQSRASYFASVQEYNRFHINLLMRLDKANPSQGFDALAVEASERARARGLLEQLTEAGAGIREGVDAALLGRERTLARQLNAKAAAQMQLLSGPHTPDRAAALKQEVSQLEYDYEQAQAEIRRTSPRYAALTQPQSLTLKELQQQVLDPDTLLLEYSLGEDGSYLWAITRDSITSFELPRQEQIKEAATNLYNLLTARSRSERGETAQQKQQRVGQAEARLSRAASGLSSMVLGPVAAQLGNKRLVIVADGTLQYVPFAMLPAPEIGRETDRESRRGVNPRSAIRNSQSPRPLIVDHEIISLPSASTLAVQRKEFVGRKPASKMVAVIADPVFSPTDDRLNTRPQKSDPVADAQVTGGESVRIFEHLSESSGTGRLSIPRLPFTRREADQIISVAPGKANLEAVDFKANRATVTSGELKDYRYLHFATHGYLDSERPALSALVLSMVDEKGQPQDGFLRANEVYNLSLPAELVVLSACQTALGKEIKGEGLVGITRGFMYAGAARVVVSLWNVNDRATSELMAKLYRKMLKENQRPAAALRAAQVEMWKQKQWQSPYYWAAFLVQGEWR